MQFLKKRILGVPVSMVLLATSVLVAAAAILFTFTALFQGSIFAPDMDLNLALTNDDNDVGNTVMINTGLDPSGPLDTLGPGPTWPDHGYDFAVCTATIVGPVDLTIDWTDAYEGAYCSILVRFNNPSSETMDLLGITVDGAGSAPVSIVQQEACGVISIAPAGVATTKFTLAVDADPVPGPWAGEAINFEWALAGSYICP